MIKSVVRRDFKKLDKNEEISKIFGYIYGESPLPIIMDGKKPWGIIDERRLLKRKLSGNEKVKNFVVGVPKLDASYSIEKAREKMVEGGQPFIIVTYGGGLAGYITAVDISIKIGVGKAGDMMKEVEPLNENDSMATAINRLKQVNEAVLPVTKEDKFVGVIRIRDVLRLETTHEKIRDYRSEKTSPLDAPVKGFMETGVRCVSPEAREEVIKIVDKQGFAIVCKNGEYIGIINMIDLVR